MVELLTKLWNSAEPAQNFILAILLSLVTAGIISFFRAKVKLTWGSTSVSLHKFKISDAEDAEPIRISTEKLFVQNVGKKAASSIELIFSDIPSSYTLWSPREHTSTALDGGGFSIQVPTLAPKELLIVDIVDIDVRNPKLIAVNCPDALSKPVDFLVQRRFNKTVNGVVLYLMSAGLVGTIFFVLRLFFGG